MERSLVTQKKSTDMRSLDAAGERRLRQLLLALDLIAFLGIAAGGLLLWRYRSPGQDPYFVLQLQAGLTYLLIWSLIAACAAICAAYRRTVSVAGLLTILLFSEGLAHGYFYYSYGRLYHPWSQAILNRFEPNPLLVGIPHPGKFGAMSHDDQHRRTTINTGKVTEPKRIFVFGGSTAYDVGNIDAHTWASDLSRLLGPGFEVQNYGVPGYTSLEAMIQSLFVFRATKVACAVYYEGWNDLRMSHMKGLRNDYSDNQLPGQLGTLGVGYRPGIVATNFLALQLVAHALSGEDNRYGIMSMTGEVSTAPDPHLAQIYSENMGLTADVDMSFGVKPIFIPQVVNYDYIEARYMRWWPLIPAEGVRPLMRQINETLRQAAKASGAPFIDTPLSVKWELADFVDEGHFSAAGSAKFAAAIADDIRANCQ
jgi:hypothetical protein